MKISGLLSDCDGVIVDSEIVVQPIVIEVLGPIFPKASTGTLTQGWLGLTVNDFIRSLEERYRHPLDEYRRRKLQEEIDIRIANAAKPTARVVSTYQDLGLPIAVVSNSAIARLKRSVERAGLMHLVKENLVSAADLGVPKPAPDAYLRAAANLGLLPEECLVVEDSMVGVRAGVAAGMTVVGFLGGSHIGPDDGMRLRGAGARGLFADMTELPGIINSMNHERTA